MFYLTKTELPFFLPLGFVGVYRWFWFFVRVLAYCLYKPIKPRRHPRHKPYRDVTILVPTIDSGDEIKLALRSWLRNNPYEVIFITTPGAQPALEALATEVDPQRRTVRVITIGKPNKRNQMVAGINHVKTDIIVFCDDDVLWPDTMLDWLLAPFEDRQMGGVGTSQTVKPTGDRMTIWEILAAFRISMRNIEITSTTYIDGGVCCLSGRTAAYRTAILRDPKFQWDFTHEFWLKKFHQHSGDDKFLTRWMHSHAWKTYIQCCPQAELQSTFKNNWRFLKQLLRWTRNTWRSDIRSLIFERHIWARHPFVAFTMLDKFFNPLTLLAGPVTVAYLSTRRDQPIPIWVVVTSYIVWLLVTRLIKYMPHFVRRPQDVLVIPVWLVFNLYFVLMKIYCLFTLHVTDWGTRAGADHKEEHDDLAEIYVPHWEDDHSGDDSDDEIIGIKGRSDGDRNGGPRTAADHRHSTSGHHDLHQQHTQGGYADEQDLLLRSPVSPTDDDKPTLPRTWPAGSDDTISPVPENLPIHHSDPFGDSFRADLTHERVQETGLERPPRRERVPTIVQVEAGGPTATALGAARDFSLESLMPPARSDAAATALDEPRYAFHSTSVGMQRPAREREQRSRSGTLASEQSASSAMPLYSGAAAGGGDGGSGSGSGSSRQVQSDSFVFPPRHQQPNEHRQALSAFAQQEQQQQQQQQETAGVRRRYESGGPVEMSLLSMSSIAADPSRPPSRSPRS
ncbi:glycosyltransferase like family 2-domain-containing protein [Entophlyctis helioformis]|nr:glycosyltransferase like family 2-domain-containing protein [Entophlyctis helioformis]